tara:strand:- start:188 stop:292 length:105 start_codon:yes stop_codon:yes gene_type:complete
MAPQDRGRTYKTVVGGSDKTGAPARKTNNNNLKN